MHEIRISVPQGKGAEVAAIALRTGIRQAAVSPVYLHGPDRPADLVSVEVSTPQAKAFVDAVFAYEDFDPETWSITSRELRAIMTRAPAREITRPMIEPAIDVFQDLWQLSHVTPGYLARASAAAVLLAYGMMENSAVAIVVAALFLPFLAIVLALAFGLWSEDRALAGHAAFALAVSIVVSFLAGAAVAALHGPPMAFHDFRSPLVSFAISAAVGVAAGLSTADDAGRRYLIGVAAAVQYAVYPVWFGAASVLGFPPWPVVAGRLLTLAINVVTIGGVAALAYRLLGMRRDEIHRFVKSRFWR